jgi:CheY-like chemotaxis protein
MVEQAGAAPGDAETNVAAARAQFVSSLGRRLEALRLALATVEQNPRSAAQRDHLRRRIHAFGAAAGVLGFERVFEAFREAETALGRTAQADDSDLAFVAQTLDLVPSLVLGADVRGRAPSSSSPLERRAGSWPVSVLVYAAAPLVESLSNVGGAEGSALELERTEDPEAAEQIVRIMAPDVAVVDADRRGARELMETLVYDPLLDPVRIIAIGTFDRPEAAATLVALGVARVLPKPVSPDTLKRSVLEVSRERAMTAPRTEPIGDQTIESLTENLAQELRHGLVDAVKAQSRGLTVSFGEGTDVLAAVWASVARVRELVTLRSGGAVRFDATGPEGAVPLAPWMGDGEHRTVAPGERRGREDVSLSGRVIVVADDDPAVAWFLSGLFRAAGAEVYEAHDGDRALELVREKWSDLIVSDILMPGLDGFSLCREIKRDVVLADTPVILLSWKEDLLQRVRELGVEADGFLRKEATASVVVQRVREVLLPRARVEARISSSGEARGRLDGLTPRLVLELATKHVQDSRVTIRDAGFLYEAHIRGGRLRSTTRTGIDGRSEKGDRVLAALLGVRAGRFSIQKDKAECSSDWSGNLREVLAPAVERARAATRALSDLNAVGRVDVDMQGFEPYSAVTPEPARDVVRRLAEGTSPETLIASGVPARLVESVLADVVRHGAVRRIVGRDGDELFPRGLGEAEAARARSVSPGLKVAASPQAKPDIPALRAVPRPARQTPAAPTVATAPPGESQPEAPKIATPPPAAAAPGLAAAAPTPPIEPLPVGVRTLVMPAAIPPMPVEPSPLALASTLIAGQLEAKGEANKPPPIAVEPDERAESKKASGGDSAFDVEQTFAALISDSIVPSPPSDRSGDSMRPSPGKNLAPPTSAPPEPSPLEAALRGLPTQVVTGASGPVPPVEPRPSEKGPRTSPSGTLIVTPAGLVAGESLKEASRKETPLPLDKTKPAEEKPKPSQAKPEDRTLETPAMDLATAIVTSASETPEPPRNVPARPSSGQLPKAPPASSRHATLRGVPSVVPAPSARPPESSPKGSSPSPPRPSQSAPEPGKDRFARGVVVLVIAAAVSYGLLTALRGRLEPSATPPAVSAHPVPVEKVAPAEPAATATEPATAPAPSALAAPSAVPVETAQRGVWPVQDMDLPSDVAVAPDRGLLEIDVAAPHSIYVDGVFIGRGPTRRIPLREGPHEVRVRGDGVDAVQSIEVRKARRVRLGTTNPQ